MLRWLCLLLPRHADASIQEIHKRSLLPEPVPEDGDRYPVRWRYGSSVPVLVCHDASHAAAAASVYLRSDRRRHFYLTVRHRHCNRVNRRSTGKQCRDSAHNPAGLSPLPAYSQPESRNTARQPQTDARFCYR